MIGPPDAGDIVVFFAAADFRAWLEENHDSARELWVGYYKKGGDGALPRPRPSTTLNA